MNKCNLKNGQMMIGNADRAAIGEQNKWGEETKKSKKKKNTPVCLVETGAASDNTQFHSTIKSKLQDLNLKKRAIEGGEKIKKRSEA